MVSRWVTRVRAVPTAASTRPARPMRRRPRSRCAARSGPAERRWRRRSTIAANSSGAMPPSGPTTNITDFACAKARSVNGPSADSCSASTVPPGATSSRSAGSAPQSTARRRPTGCSARRDCCAAARATARQRRRPLSARTPSQRATQRAACHATNASAPASVASSMASSERSDFGSAWTTVTGGRAGATCQRSTTRARSPSRAVCSTTQRASAAGAVAEDQLLAARGCGARWRRGNLRRRRRRPAHRCSGSASM